MWHRLLSHMKDRRLFESYTPLDEPIAITGISSQPDIVGEGSVTLRFSLKDGKHRDITLNDVAYVPSASINLFSVGVAAGKGVRLDTVTGELVRVTDRLVVGYAPRHYGLYPIRLQNRPIAMTAISHREKSQRH